MATAIRGGQGIPGDTPYAAFSAACASREKPVSAFPYLPLAKKRRISAISEIPSLPLSLPLSVS